MFEEGLAELHTHLGGSVASDILWSLAHEQGIALPTRDYWEFERLVTVSDPRGVPDLDSLDQIYHLTELIQSSPLAVERSVHAAIGGAYRSQRITTLELRFNPMKRNRGGERDLDHIILAAIRGLDLASLEYSQVRAGLILMMDRTFTADQNMVIVEKAIKYMPRGVVGVDIAGPRPHGARYDYTQIREHVELRASAGLGVTIHVGEEGGEHGVQEIGEVVESLRPDRLGHGILAAREPALMEAIREAGITLEICPTSNLLTKALDERGRGTRDVSHLRRARCAVHDRNRRPRDDAHPPAGRVRAARADRRARRERAAARQRAWPRRLVRRAARPRPRLARRNPGLNRLPSGAGTRPATVPPRWNSVCAAGRRSSAEPRPVSGSQPRRRSPRKAPTWRCSPRRRDVLERDADRIGALAVRGDVTNSADLERLVERTLEAFGGIDIVVWNSGGPPAGKASEITDLELEAAFELLLQPAVRLVRLALPHIRKSAAGRIVFITSATVKEPTPHLALSNALRPGLTGWAKTLSRELGPEGITVNCVAPGRIDTPRMTELYGAGGPPPEELAQIPLGRLGTPREFGDVVCFLASHVPPTSRARRSSSTAAARAASYEAHHSRPAPCARRGPVRRRARALRLPVERVHLPARQGASGGAARDGAGRA